jgi:hypothetical protein
LFIDFNGSSLATLDPIDRPFVRVFAFARTETSTGDMGGERNLQNLALPTLVVGKPEPGQKFAKTPDRDYAAIAWRRKHMLGSGGMLEIERRRHRCGPCRIPAIRDGRSFALARADALDYPRLMRDRLRKAPSNEGAQRSAYPDDATAEDAD